MATIIVPPNILQERTSTPIQRSVITSLQDWILNPPAHTEWVENQLQEKIGMTLKHGQIQSKLSASWRKYVSASGLGGEVYTDAPCQTLKQGRRPDVAYLTPALFQQYGQEATLPLSFPLIAEIISPTDLAEDIFAKAQEYLQSGSEEVWLILPESHYIFVLMQQQILWFGAGTVVSTQVVLKGFSIAVDELLS